MANVGTAAKGKTLIGNGNGQSPRFADIGSDSGLTAHSVVIAEGTSAFSVAAPGTAGTVLTSNGAGSDPTFQTIGSAGGITSITGNSGGAEVPLAGNFNVLGTGSITVAGSANTETVQLTGLTNHAVLIGAGTATITKVGPTSTSGQILQSQGASADPAFSTATYPSTTTANQILYSSATNTVSGLASANSGTIVTNSTGVPSFTSMTDGQVIIGSTGATPTAATLTAGSGISITNASGAITITATMSGFPWTDVTTATQAMVINNGYVNDRAGGVTYTLPATASLGDLIKIAGKLGQWTVQENSGQQIVVGSASCTVTTGTLSSTDQGDCVDLLCIVPGASTVWRATNFVGNLTVT